MGKFHSTFSRVKSASSLCVEHPVWVYTRLGAQCRDSFAFLILCARAHTCTRFYHTLAIFFRPPVRRLVLTPRDSLVTAASRYRPLGQEPTRCPALRTQTSEGALYYALCFWYESLETSRQNCVRGGSARFPIHGVALDIVCYILPTKFENSLLQLFILFIFNNRKNNFVDPKKFSKSVKLISNNLLDVKIKFLKFF